MANTKRIHGLTPATLVAELDEFIFSIYESQGTRRIAFSDLFNNFLALPIPSDITDQGITPDPSSLYALKTTISSVLTSINTLSNQLSNKVDKDGSKVLSTNDFTTALKTKLEGIDEGATKNVNVATTSNNGLMSTAQASKVAAIGSTGTLSSDYAASSSRNGLMSKSQAAQLAALPSSYSAIGKVKVGSNTMTADSAATQLEISAVTNLTAALDVGNKKLTITGPPTATAARDGLITSTLFSKLNGLASSYYAYIRDSSNTNYTPTNGKNYLKFVGSGTAKVGVSQSTATTTVTVTTPSRAWVALHSGDGASGTTAVSTDNTKYSAFYALVFGGKTNNIDYYTSFFIPARAKTSSFILTNNYPAGSKLADSGYVALDIGVNSIAINKSYYGGVDRTTSAKLYLYGLPAN